MNVEHLTKEELANELLSGDWTGHAKDLTDEAARRLRNSIQKPVVTIEEFVREVERRAEVNMMKTGKLEGSHYAAMKKYQKELGLEGGGE